jgi:2-polyprenyl-3-methyl-5-hydroxy-6-metoxy-1,4-benzoquinol methylase
MNVEEMVSNWNAWGTQDPMYAILTDPDKVNGQWKEEEFFASGEKQIEERLKWLREAGVALAYGKALDFGCGIGRLTNALAKYFEVVHGVDISASMIERAKQLCRFRGKISYFQNTASNLQSFASGTYDLVYTEIVLQHISPKYQLSYIEDFFRLLSPRGIAFFQTVRTVGWRSLVPNWLAQAYRSRKHKGHAFIPMFSVRPEAIKQLISRNDCRLLQHKPFAPTDANRRFLCDVFVVAK